MKPHRLVDRGKRSPQRRGWGGLLALPLLLGACDLPRGLAERGLLSDAAPGAIAPGSESAETAAGPRRAAPAFESVGRVAAPRRVNRVVRSLPAVPGDRQVALDFRDTEADRVAREVLGDVLGLPVVVDPGLRGRITLRTEGRVPAADVPRLLDGALAPLGWGIASSGGRVRVGRLAELEAPGGPGQAETRIIPLDHLRPEEIIPVLTQNAPEGTRITADPSSRAVVVTGSGTSAAAVEELVRLFDADTLASRSFGVYPLASATPAQVVRELEGIFVNARNIRFIAVERLNAVLAVADAPSALVRARQAIARLDVAPTAASGVQVYPLRHRRATEMAEILGRLFGTAGGGAPARGSPVGEFGALRVGPSGGASGVAARPPGGATGEVPAAPPTSVAAGGSGAPVTADAGGSLTPAQLAAELGLSGPVRVQADPGRNALVVLAAPADFRIIERTVRQLDVRPRQVFIEAAIAEVSLNDGLRYGVDYSLRIGDGRVAQAGVLDTAGLLRAATPAAAISALGGIGGGLAFVLSNTNIGLTIQALSNITDVQVVSAPRVMVLDNETATLQVGNQVPVLTRQAQSVDSATAPTVNAVDLRDTGVILSVRPRVGAGGSVSLDIFQEVSDAVPTGSSTINSPTIQLRRLQSTINIQSGDTVALGGLMRDRATRDRRGIPFLSNLDVIGGLFGSRAAQTDRTELLILLTPRVVDDAGDMRALADELRAKLGSLSPELSRAVARPGRGERLDPQLPPPRGPLPEPIRTVR